MKAKLLEGKRGLIVGIANENSIAWGCAKALRAFGAWATGGTIDAQMPARSLVSIDDVGAATACLAHDAARLITGEPLYIDGDYHIID